MSNDKASNNLVLVLDAVGQPLRTEVRSIPKAGYGSAVIRILAASIRPNSPHVYEDPESGHPLPVPFIPGFTAIGRVHEAGPDATSLKPGRLVLFDNYIRGRDNEDAVYVSGLMEGFNQESGRLAKGIWRDSTYAQYARLPLENCHLLDERLNTSSESGGMGYTIEDLAQLFNMTIPFGGLDDIDIQSGETIIIAPATGRYGSAAVYCALAMGAKVIAVGRNGNTLSDIASLSNRVQTVQLSADVEKDTKEIISAARGPIDAFFDMSPREASESSHFQSCLQALSKGARVSLMGAVSPNVKFGYMEIMMKQLTVKGTWMCKREQTKRLIRMVETGVLPLGPRAKMGPVKTFELSQWREAFKYVKDHKEPGEIVFAP
ncbi:alcohol dehydrogenase [Fusarium denticulatum]|uniref:Alcohol dehydrogenase n=1 Tax=Fusarium denticulatum TaxID=48507 RepID=A0A8H5TZS7_9HYPO|nr:alcohol dehydrogenase [Fusarium denticulatum]